MKKYSEKRIETTVDLMLKTLIKNFNDTGVILDEFESVHNEFECDHSKQYAALVAGHFALKEAIDKINHQLNK